MLSFLTIGFLLDWTIRIGALFIVPKNRKPSSATAWLMLIFLFPYVGVCIFLLLGSPKLNKKRRKMQKNMDVLVQKILHDKDTQHLFEKYIEKNPSENVKPFIQLNQNLSGFPAFNGNKVELLSDYDGAIKSIARDIRKASKYVHIEYFIIALDQSTEILFHEMEQAVGRGVKVRVMFDAIGSKKYPRFKEMKNRLTSIGVDWHPMLPLKMPGKNFNRPDLRNHRKIVVIDGLCGYTGSQNLVTRNYHRKDELYYDELVVRIEGPVVLQLQAAFITDWYAETDILLARANNQELQLQTVARGTTLCQILPSGPGFDNDNNLKLFTSLIHAAKSHITIVNPYFIPDDSLVTAITSAAQRGVTVTMINSEIIDQAMVGYAQRSYFEELLKAGVQLYQYNTPILLHSKFLTIDESVAVIGSSNLDMRSFQLDLEVTLLAYDKHIVEKLQSVTKTYLKRSKQLSLKTWNKRPLQKKLFENLARLTSAVQ